MYEGLEEAKAKFLWDNLIGTVSEPTKDGYVLRSANGFPYATMHFSEIRGHLKPTFGHPVGMQRDWVKQQELTNE